ncbi:MAG: Trk system potassium transporter TrkA [Flavobacteriales bacterium]|nr:Trk system potassium transporter TrkA [Flavobacteriales bacterium]
MRIIIAGAGQVGFHLAKMLAKENHNITVIDRDKKLLEQASTQLDVLTVRGNSNRINVLQDSNANKADLLIAVTSLEETNITTCALGKQLGAKRTIARINNAGYQDGNTLIDFEKLGIDHLVYPAELVVEEIIQLLNRSGLSNVHEFSGGKLSLIGAVLGEDAPAVGKSLVDITGMVDQVNFTLVAIHRNKETIIPRGDTILEKNDHLYIITPPEEIDILRYLSGKKKIEIKKIMVLGGSKIGELACSKLERQYDIKLIEKDRLKCFDLANDLNRTLILNGDGRDVDFLEEEGIKDMDAFIAVSGDSETNIISSLVAKNHGVNETIALVDNIDYINLSQNMGVDTLINKKLAAASFISKFIREGELKETMTLPGVNAEVLEYVVKADSKIADKSVKEIDFPRGAVIGGMIRGEKGFTVNSTVTFRANDEVVVFSLPEAIYNVEKLFK